MEEVINFLNDFFQSEVNAIKASDQADLDNFNDKLEIMNQFLVDDLKNNLGMIPLKELKDPNYYERVKNYPPPDPRFLFRIDTYKSNDKDYYRYHCFVSDSNPDDWRSYLNSFVVDKEGGEFKIFSMFFFSDKGMGGDKKWHFNAGEDRFMNKENGQYLLNIESLGDRIEINRITEPSDDADSMKEYNKD
ncbi:MULTISPECIES: hypothetical protein [Aquimarina]|uniref:hypothetical protein n=1 Tax=Aquimarina TaxID=290174 RepID=UPI000D55F69D|nr:MULTISPECIES: hypothetical protein [Aquimarina]